jgi:hypothetical protein
MIAFLVSLMPNLSVYKFFYLTNSVSTIIFVIFPDEFYSDLQILSNQYFLYYSVFPEMPLKRKTSAVNLRSTRKNAGKITLESVSIVTPTKNESEISSKASVPTEKKPIKRTKKVSTINAVMHTKSGGAKVFKTAKQATAYLQDMQANFGADIINDMKLVVFQNKQAFLTACSACKNDHNPSAMIPRQVSVPLLGVENPSTNQHAKRRSLAEALTSQFDSESKPAAVIPIPKQAKVSHSSSSTFFQNLPMSIDSGKKNDIGGNRNKLAESLKSQLNLFGIRLQIILFPPIKSISDNQAYQVFAIDVLENRNGNTLWTHKPSAWQDIFTMDQSLSQEQGGHNIDPFFYSLRYTFRRNVPKGPNQKKTLTTNNNRMIECQVLWGLIIAEDNTEERLKTEAMKFAQLASDQNIQAAYLVTMKNLGTQFTPLLEQIMPPKTGVAKMGEYWEKLMLLCNSEEIQVLHCQSLNELFLDDVISTVISILWAAGGLSTSMWSAEMNMFAFGHP